MMRRVAIGGAVWILLWASADARGVSPYLPLNLSPDVERKIERVLLLGDKPAMRRPIPAAVVLDALPKACTRDAQLCAEVRAYLERFMRRGGVAHARIGAAAVDGDAVAVLPNAHGLHVDSPWEARVQAYYQPNDHLLIAAGGIARDEEAIPTDSMISLGFDFAQFDLGYRDHWLSPLTDSSSLIGTQVPTMLSATLSNYQPISPFGFSYEIFGAEMSEQEGIAVPGSPPTQGSPRLAGVQLGLEPADGYALTLNRVTQYGGGARGGRGLSDFFDALFQSANTPDAPGETDEVNRVASVASSILFQGAIPFAVHIEYAGEDNTYEGKHRLGATNLSLGVDLPALWRDFDASFEISEWQNDWYIHHIYAEGLTNRDHVIGHWFGDNRLLGDAIGGRSYMLRSGWLLPRGDYAQLSYRNLEFDPDWESVSAERPYETMHVMEATYSTVWRDHQVDAQLQLGRDIFGDSFVRLGAAFDFARKPRAPRGALRAEPEAARSTTEYFVDLGVQYMRAREYLLLESQQRDTSAYEPNVHFGIGARRRVSERSDLGFRLELDEVDGYSLLSLRALDYRYRLRGKLAFGAFIGAGRYDINLAAHGWYLGGGVHYRDVLPGWDVALDYRFYDKLSRDKGLPSDPESNPGLPRRVIDIDGLSLYVSKRW